MPEIQVISQLTQLAKEVPEGIRATSGFQKLQSLSFDMGSDGNVEFFRPTGFLYDTVYALGKEWTHIAVTGMPSFDELPYPFCSLLKNVSPLLGASSGVTGVNVTAGGSGYTSAPTIAFSGGAGTGAAATAIVVGGAVVGANITAPGSGYTSAPTIAFSGGGGGTGAAATASFGSRLWTFDPSSIAGTPADAVTTYTVEQGTSGFVHFATGCFFSEFGFNLDRQKTDAPGVMLGRKFDTNTANSFGTAAATQIGLGPVIPTQFSIYLETSASALGPGVGATTGATKLTRAFVSNYKIANRFGPLWPIDAAQASFAGRVELPPAATFDLTVMADAVGLPLYADMRAGNKKFCRVVSQGPAIAGGSDLYTFQSDMCIGLDMTKKFGNQDGALTLTWPCKIMHDAAWNRAILVKIINTLAAL